ncbi:TrkH family potassium uptake protein [Herbiconiux sp. SYSU D00978]|uniref:TrkH family potassium uptake protein n=1 Tax=Herbiconiux sp. SYSU D00978 TaxID=2812562 RepID=UPI001A978540|nr:potassium transporter TrkG [Herbiconiux sp. SYSU D00978]
MQARPAARTNPVARVRDRFDDFATASPSRFAILIFAALIAVTTILLLLPISRRGEGSASFADALFTAISTICVTGLSTVDMSTHWTPFGHVVIVIGVQIGAVGVLTLASILGLVISRRLGLKQRLIAAGDSNPLRIHRGPVAEGQAVRLGEIGNLLITVALSVVVIEAVVAVLLFPTVLLEGYGFADAAWIAVSFSIMAFTNTGFTLHPDGLAPFAADPWFLGLLMVAVFLGSIGFPVIHALLRHPTKPRRWSLHVKLTLTTYLGLFVLGTLAYFVLEFTNPATIGGMDPGQRVLQSTFLSMMTRSGGFATFDTADLHGSSLLVTDMLMFIGGGSASTAGGIKVTTLAILFLAAYAEARGSDSMEAFERRIPSDVLRVSVSVVLWSATIVALACIILLQLTNQRLDYVLFDVISAFATSGLTTGLTAEVDDPGKYVLAATMFMGRVGTVTLAAAVAASERRQLYRRAEERPIVG